MAKKNKKEVVERIPQGMSREEYADAAFRKKVTIIMGCILLVFVIGVCAVIFAGWYKNEQHNKEFEEKAAAFQVEKNNIKAELAKYEEYDDKAAVVIDVNDDNFYDWIAELDSTYQLDSKDKNYAAYGGATIKLQGMFVTKEFSGVTVYWVYRSHSHDEGDHSHEHGEEAGEEIPIEIIFRDDSEVEIPKDGTWVEVTGIVGPDSTKNLSAVRYAEIKVMDEPGQEFID